MFGGKIALIAGVVVALMLAALWWTNKQLTAANKEIGAQAGEIYGLQEAVKFQIKLTEVNAKHNKDLDDQEAEHNEELQGKENEYRAQAQNSFKESQIDPDAFDHRITASFIDWMCDTEARGDNDRKQACVSASKGASESDVPFTLTVTQKTAADYIRGCEIYRGSVKSVAEDGELPKYLIDQGYVLDEDGELPQSLVDLSDMCHWSLTGFPPESLYNILLPHMLKVTAERDSWINYVEVLKSLIIAQGGEIKEKPVN